MGAVDVIKLKQGATNCGPIWISSLSQERTALWLSSKHPVPMKSGWSRDSRKIAYFDQATGMSCGAGDMAWN